MGAPKNPTHALRARFDDALNKMKQLGNEIFSDYDISLGQSMTAKSDMSASALADILVDFLTFHQNFVVGKNIKDDSLTIKKKKAFRKSCPKAQTSASAFAEASAEAETLPLAEDKSKPTIKKVSPKSRMSKKLVDEVPKNVSGMLSSRDSLPEDVIPLVDSSVELTPEQREIAFKRLLESLEKAAREAGELADQLDALERDTQDRDTGVNDDEEDNEEPPKDE